MNLRSLFSALCLLFAAGCATRVTVRTPERTVEIVLPKDHSVSDLDLKVNPQTGEFTLKAKELSANASRVITKTVEAAATIAK